MIKKSIFIFLVILIFINGCSNKSVEPKPVAGDTIYINHFIFEPAELIVSTGATVTWKHNDNVAHTVVSQGLFESKVLNRNDEFSFKFTSPGEYSYHCSIHPSMNGKIIVK